MLQLGLNISRVVTPVHIITGAFDIGRHVIRTQPGARSCHYNATVDTLTVFVVQQYNIITHHRRGLEYSRPWAMDSAVSAAILR